MTYRARSTRFGYVLTLLVSAVLTAGCGGGGGGGSSGGSPGNGNSETDNADDQVVCAENIKTLVDGLATKTPTWEELSCFTDGLTRLSAPGFIKRILLGSDTLPEDATAWQVHLEQVEQTWQAWPINVSNSLPGPLPPYLSDNGRTYPMSLEALDLEMRSYATVLLYEKLDHNRPLYFSHFWPPYAVQEFESEAAYQAWMENVYLPELEVVATAAEFVKAEYFSPFLLEAEVFATGLGDWFETLDENQQLAIAQDFVDRVYQTVRPRYNGILIAHSYARYAAKGDHWVNISYAQYDQINFALFPECNIEATESYLDDQFSKYMAIAARDNVPYMINELTVYREKLFLQPCPSFDFDANEAALYQAVFDKINAQPIAPVGLSAGSPRSEAARATLEAYFDAH